MGNKEKQAFKIFLKKIKLLGERMTFLKLSSDLGACPSYLSPHNLCGKG